MIGACGRLRDPCVLEGGLNEIPASSISASGSRCCRALAVTSNTRSPFAPDIPTIAETGLPEFDVSSWYAIFLPVKTPTEIVKKVHDDVVLALAHPSIKQSFEAIGVVGSPSTPAELSGYLKAETAKWGPIIKAANIKVE
jgi:tripartite-type tricarboxylate transporter receptor subunit TctC